MEKAIRDAAIVANLAALFRTLDAARTRTLDASAAADAGAINQAVGAALGVDTLLDEARALFSAAIALHRGR
ncbi:hypothetical protein [Methylobacterium sp. WSM2598]|uniref:hypothetical protein n=1 Tax=Methylobacterium sp. WSM2598 TaxID=398261 RepID=UPI00035D6F20|nr:hypothetical protein [Methylobacterium sp. WSM2598]